MNTVKKSSAAVSSIKFCVHTVEFNGVADVGERRQVPDCYFAAVEHLTAEWTGTDWTVMVQHLQHMLALFTQITSTRGLKSFHFVISRF